MSAERRDRWGRLQGLPLSLYLLTPAIEVDNVCLGGCGALVDPPYQICGADCYDALVREVSAYRASLAAASR